MRLPQDSSPAAYLICTEVAQELGAQSGGSGPARDSLLVMTLFAFTGGFILNLMPCVFPVLSIKAVSLLKAAEQDDLNIRRNALCYTAGVFVSFYALVGFLLILRAGGSSLGWGFQLQSPGFVAFLACLLFAMGLNLAGRSRTIGCDPRGDLRPRPEGGLSKWRGQRQQFGRHVFD